MEPLQDNPLAKLEAQIFRQLADSGSVSIAADTLAEASCARCHEEVRVWVENFARAHGVLVEEDTSDTSFLFRYAK